MALELTKSSKPQIEAAQAAPRPKDERVSAQVTYDLTRFTLADMVQCGRDLRHLGAVSSAMEETAGLIVRYLYEHFSDRGSGRPACVLIRLFKTHPFGELSDDLRAFAQSLMPSAVLSANTKCLTLLATIGEDPQWNLRQNSQRHKAIPLLNETLNDIPMISQLLSQLGVKLGDLAVVKPEIIKNLDQTAFNVFHVPLALNNSFIPVQQEFVVRYGVESVLGFGGILPDGNLFTVIMFARVPIPASTAQMFRTIALNVKMALLPALQGLVFIE
ncbi:MAG TPA: hypothetical protein VMD75_07940 [Candidatus Binataceae bacterium]|nr:hypothetical protein [Candidatus Binataceae bacterium]